MMKKHIILILIISIVGLSSCESNKQKATKNIKEAHGLIIASDFKGALKLLDEATELDASNPEAFFLRGNVHYNLGTPELALQDYNEAIKLKKDYGEVYKNRGNLKFYMGDHNAACIDWRKADSLGIENLYEELKRCP